MCVKLLKDSQLIEYDCGKSLVDQVNGCQEVVVNYQPNDKEVEKFLSEMQTCVKNGVNPNVKVRVEYNNFLHGYKTKKQFTKAIHDINLNELVKLLTLTQHSIDKSLEELAETCANR